MAQHTVSRHLILFSTAPWASGVLQGYILIAPLPLSQVCWLLSLPVWKTSATRWQSPARARRGA